jgi:hypothetical protein
VNETCKPAPIRLLETLARLYGVHPLRPSLQPVLRPILTPTLPAQTDP